MKKIYASLGAAALSAAGIQTLQAQPVDLSKSWSVGVLLRGFYDDNVNTVPSSANPTESFGFEVGPMLSLSLPLEQTTIIGSYNYTYKYYEKRIHDRADHDDNTHTLAAQIQHNFSERVMASVRNSFVIGQEPDVLRIGNSADATFQRISGDNIRNFGAVTLNAQISRPFGVEVGYANALYDYADDSDGGFSARLDRLEHHVHIDGRWAAMRDTIVVVGYAFSLVDYTADLLIAPPLPFESDSRNNRSHYVYAGVEHNFLANLVGTLRAGARFNDYYKSPNDESEASPYVQATLSYQYAPESRIEVGAAHDRRSTDQFSFDGSSLTLDADSTVAYVSLTHRILPKLFAGVVGNFQYATFNGGLLDNEDQYYFGAGVNLEYRFNRHFSANVGYNYDRLESSGGVAGGDYDRNRVYIGAMFVY
ncbi:MAG: outer membrane beta-barrel protein [Verrucomicrobiae bacterium]|nr:outer membrane beta-barrel protein [Verrucomicrobiae bacterium]MDW8309397.1 outer membrane beta-barrel protein [Verrucomicrobiales bacterium]